VGAIEDVAGMRVRENDVIVVLEGGPLELAR